MLKYSDGQFHEHEKAALSAAKISHPLTESNKLIIFCANEYVVGIYLATPSPVRCFMLGSKLAALRILFQ
jgi:hypothetical protein